MSRGRLFGREEFDPSYIILQILSLQSVFYTTQATLTVLFNHLFGLKRDLLQVLSAESFEFWDSYSLVAVLVTCLTSPVLVLALVFVVERASKCLDFSVTIFVVHAVLVCAYKGFPLEVAWWVLQVVNLGSVVLVAEFICLKIEQQEIVLSSKQEV